MPRCKTKTNFQSPLLPHPPPPPYVHCAVIRPSKFLFKVVFVFEVINATGGGGEGNAINVPGWQMPKRRSDQFAFVLFTFVAKLALNQLPSDLFLFVHHFGRITRMQIQTDHFDHLCQKYKTHQKPKQTRVSEKNVDIVQPAQPQQNPNRTPLTWSCKFEKSAICALVLMACKSFLVIAVGPRTGIQEINKQRQHHPCKTQNTLTHSHPGRQETNLYLSAIMTSYMKDYIRYLEYVLGAGILAVDDDNW